MTCQAETRAKFHEIVYTRRDFCLNMLMNKGVTTKGDECSPVGIELGTISKRKATMIYS